MNVTNAEVKAASWWTQLPAIMRLAILCAAFIPSLGTLYAYTIGPLAGTVKREQDWRASVTETLADLRLGLTCPPSDGSAPLPLSLCAELLAQRAVALQQAADLAEVLRPVNVFAISEGLSGAPQPCVERRRCVVEAVIRRTPSGLLCHIDPTTPPRFFVINSRTGERRQVIRLNSPPPQDIGPDWVTLTVEFDTPAGLAMSAETEPPIAALVIEATYDQCLGDDDHVRVTSQSDKPIPFAIFAPSQARP